MCTQTHISWMLELATLQCSSLASSLVTSQVSSGRNVSRALRASGGDETACVAGHGTHRQHASSGTSPSSLNKTGSLTSSSKVEFVFGFWGP